MRRTVCLNDSRIRLVHLFLSNPYNVWLYFFIPLPQHHFIGHHYYHHRNDNDSRSDFHSSLTNCYQIFQSLVLETVQWPPEAQYSEVILYMKISLIYTPFSTCFVCLGGKQQFILIQETYWRVIFLPPFVSLHLQAHVCPCEHACSSHTLGKAESTSDYRLTITPEDLLSLIVQSLET